MNDLKAVNNIVCKRIRYNFLYVMFFLSVLIIATGCTSLPKDYSQIPSTAYTDTEDTQLGRSIAEISKDKNNLSGAYLLNEGLEAFAARMVLADAAERSLDIQYYIWRNDAVGKLMASSVLRAAERGVRVRLLLDDINLEGLDEELSALDSHSNIEIRIFNPFILRQIRQLEMIMTFSRINRRMHNKSFTVDNQVTIVGGRNIGDEYYDYNKDVNFNDMDILAIGPVVNEVSVAFDKYWNSEFAIPVARLVSKISETDLKELRSSLAEHALRMQKSEYIKAVAHSIFLKSLQNKTLPIYWGKASVVYDEPEKIHDDLEDSGMRLSKKAAPFINDMRSELILISPYFIPGDEGMTKLRELVDHKIRIRVLTNSLASTDVSLVYANYKPYQLPLLQAGVELYESKPVTNISNENKKIKFGSSSRASLHTKLYIFDRKKLFVGSYNLDPRSSNINTELGIIFENDSLAGEIAQWWDKNIEDWSYKLVVVDDKTNGDQIDQHIEWTAIEQGVIQRYAVEPKTSIWRRLGVYFMSILPVESFL